MNFFQRQSQARKKSFLLACLFFIGLALLTCALYFYMMVLGFLITKFHPTFSAWAFQIEKWEWYRLDIAIWICAVIALTTFYATLQKIFVLEDGIAIAQMLGGRRIDWSVADKQEKRLLNIVEEMSIASGLPIPPVFVLPYEKGINAFAAGYHTEDAVISVTRGALEQLTRDELQGVVAHEFSHILNSDILLNIRLLGVLAGVQAIAIFGQWMLYIGWLALRGTNNQRLISSQNTKSFSARGNILLAVPLLFAGAVLVGLGYIGLLWGRVVRGAFSRQREFYADAAAIQFTRNPYGLGYALLRILKSHLATQLHNTHAEETSHFFFVRGASGFLSSSLLATHPRLNQRIQHILPKENIDLLRIPAIENQSQSTYGDMGVLHLEQNSIPLSKMSSSKLTSSIGTCTAQNIAYSQTLVNVIHQDLRDQAHTALGAQAIILAMLIRENQSAGLIKMNQTLKGRINPDLAPVLRELYPLTKDVPIRSRLPLAEIAISSLKVLSRERIGQFLQIIDHLIEVDAELSPFEFALKRLIQRRLISALSRAKPPRPLYVSLTPIRTALEDILNALAQIGHDDPAFQKRAYQAGLATISCTDSKVSITSPLPPWSWQKIDRALNQMLRASPSVREQIIQACVACSWADNRITDTEAEFLRALVESLDCPVPPFIV